MHRCRQACPLDAAAQRVPPQRRCIVVVVVQMAERLAPHPVGAGFSGRAARFLAAACRWLGCLLLPALQHSTRVAVWEWQAYTCRRDGVQVAAIALGWSECRSRTVDLRLQHGKRQAQSHAVDIGVSLPPPPTPHPRTHTHKHTQAAAVRRTCKAASSQAACQHRQAVHYGPCSTK